MERNWRCDLWWLWLDDNGNPHRVTIGVMCRPTNFGGSHNRPFLYAMWPLALCDETKILRDTKTFFPKLHYPRLKPRLFRPDFQKPLQNFFSRPNFPKRDPWKLAKSCIREVSKYHTEAPIISIYRTWSWMGIPSDISEDKWLNKGGWEVIVLDKKR